MKEWRGGYHSILPTGGTNEMSKDASDRRSECKMTPGSNKNVTSLVVHDQAVHGKRFPG
jgi:hypothetical protein